MFCIRPCWLAKKGHRRDLWNVYGLFPSYEKFQEHLSTKSVFSVTGNPANEWDGFIHARQGGQFYGWKSSKNTHISWESGSNSVNKRKRRQLNQPNPGFFPHCNVLDFFSFACTEHKKAFFYYLKDLDAKTNSNKFLSWFWWPWWLCCLAGLEIIADPAVHGFLLALLVTSKLHFGSWQLYFTSTNQTQVSVECYWHLACALLFP